MHGHVVQALKGIGAVQIIVFFVNEEKLGAQKMLEYIGRMKEDQIYRAVLILQKKLSGPANSERMLVKNSYRIEDVRTFPAFVTSTREACLPVEQQNNNNWMKATLVCSF